MIPPRNFRVLCTRSPHFCPPYTALIDLRSTSRPRFFPRVVYARTEAAAQARERERGGQERINIARRKKRLHFSLGRPAQLLEFALGIRCSYAARGLCGKNSSSGGALSLSRASKPLRENCALSRAPPPTRNINRARLQGPSARLYVSWVRFRLERMARPPVSPIPRGGDSPGIDCRALSRRLYKSIRASCLFQVQIFRGFVLDGPYVSAGVAGARFLSGTEAIRSRLVSTRFLVRSAPRPRGTLELAVCFRGCFGDCARGRGLGDF